MRETRSISDPPKLPIGAAGGRPRLYDDFLEIEQDYEWGQWVAVRPYKGRGAWEIAKRIRDGRTKVPGGAEQWEIQVGRENGTTTTLWALRKK